MRVKLLTAAIEKQIPRLLTDVTESSKVVAKFFTPDGAGTWFILAGDKEPNGDWRFFALCDLGMGSPELGYVMLSELLTVRGSYGLKIERDRFYEGTLADARREVRS
jgi:Protein of unknown function (DUF2958)